MTVLERALVFFVINQCGHVHCTDTRMVRMIVC